MKIAVLLFALFLLAGALPAQQKGAAPLPATAPATAPVPVTRAVVIGISDYHDPAITDLKFADRDAVAFADWLQSAAGGGVPADNIRLLTNENATGGKFAMALTGLLEDCKPGDRAIIYFSGHGDVEAKTVFQLGFLLCWDSPAQNYMGGGFNIVNLQAVVATLADNSVHVVLITDACHAGKLAGNAVGGAQLTSANLAKQFANESKILSCQPNEFALESTQWGGGRGCFSYHLVEGLTGLADKNGDALVTLSEIDRYLGDIVPAETAPQVQTPFTIGDRNNGLARVDALALDDLKKLKSGQSPVLQTTAFKGFDDVLSGTADSAALALYRKFEAALEKGDLLEPADANAWDLYRQCLQQDALRPAHNIMRRNLAAALLDDAQQTLNGILTDNPYEINNWISNPAKYAQYPQYIQRTMELLGEQHYLYRSLQAKKCYFEGYNLFNNLGSYVDHPALRDSFRQEAKNRLFKSLELEPGAAYAYYSIGNLVEKTGNRALADSNIYWLRKAVELAPTWKQPCVNIGEVYLNWLAELDSAETWLTKAYALDSNSYFVLQELSWLRQCQHRPEEANAICRKMIALRPDLPGAYATLGHTLLYLQGDVAESANYFWKAIEIGAKTKGNAILTGLSFCPAVNLIRLRRPGEAVRCVESGLQAENLDITLKSLAYTMLVTAYIQQGQYEKAAEIIRKTEQICTDQFILSQLEAEKGHLQLLQGQPAQAERTLLHGLTIDETDDDLWIRMWAFLGRIKAAQNRPLEAEAYFRKAVTFRGMNTANFYWEEAWFFYGQFLLSQNRDEEARRAFEKSKTLYPSSFYAPYGLALLAAKQGRKTDALDALENALDNFWPEPVSILAEPLFIKIRNTKRFTALLAKHFPPGWETL